ncbi:methyltransferase domain-containing protein [Candidatus Woesearchaeota archaeon]|nr:methyltransferase domain-containing protein [Candidatus Woesearchaeota archaeon]
MKHIFLLSKENIELAKQEVLALAKPKNNELIDNLLVINTKLNMQERLAYTHSVYGFLFKSNKNKLIEKIGNYNWQKIYKNNFCVRCINSNDPEKEKELAGYIWNSLKKPKVKLNNSETEIHFFFAEDIVVCGLFIADTDKSYLKRKAHLRPELHPTSLHPGLARAMINLTGKLKGRLCDPFCGTGGILIEAGFMGFNITGYDIENEIIEKCKTNLNYYKIKSHELKIHNSEKINNKFDCIVTDLPYGKGSKASNLERLYFNFLKSAYDSTDIVVAGFPDFIDSEKIIRKTRWKTKDEFIVYLHKSLSKRIFVLIKSICF